MNLLEMDVKTIFLQLAMGNIILTILFMSFPKVNNKKAEWLWIFAKLCETIAYSIFLHMVVSKDSRVVIVLGGNFLLYWGFAFEAAALWEYRKHKSWFRFIIPALILAVGIRSYAEILGLPANLKITISSYIVGIFFVVATVPFIPQKREARGLSLVIIITNSIPTLANFMRGTMSYFMLDNTLSSGNSANILTYLAMYIFMVSNGFGFLLLVRENEERELLHLATFDSLTELLNRRAFLEYAENNLVLERRRSLYSAMLVFDIDNFKRINDTYGHAAGDLVLQDFARICRDQFRKTDIIGRIGGEEFAAILNGCTIKDAVQVAENLRRSVAENTIDINTVEVRFTVSIGLLMFSEGETLSDALVRADKALYTAKQTGRNKVVIA